NRGATVSKPSVREAHEVFAARQVLEAGTVTRCIEVATRADCKRLHQHVTREQAAWRQGDRRASLKYSGEFHLIIAEVGGNRILMDMLRDLVSRSSLIIAVYQAPGAPCCPPDEHREIARALERRKLPLTVFATALALRRHPEALAAYRELGHEIAGHGLRWISYQLIDEDTERAHLAQASAILAELTGSAPLGWYTGRDSPNTRRLLVEHGGFLYDADSYADDLPYWTHVRPGGGTRTVPHLVVPYTLDCNDMRFATAQGLNAGTQFFDYLRDAFDTLYREGDPAGLDAPTMLSVGLHARLIGRPGRIACLERFLDYALEHEGVWVCRRVHIARHWTVTHPSSRYSP